MTIFDIFKKTKEEPKERETEKIPEVQVEKKQRKPAKPGKRKSQKPERQKDFIKRPKEKFAVGAYRILKGPHITEKATDLAKSNQYIFKVYPRTNKTEIKKAIEGLYGVDVVSVNIVNNPPRKKRVGKIEGWIGGCKKAIIKIKEGQTIEVLPR